MVFLEIGAWVALFVVGAGVAAVSPLLFEDVVGAAALVSGVEVVMAVCSSLFLVTRALIAL